MDPTIISNEQHRGAPGRGMKILIIWLTVGIPFFGFAFLMYFLVTTPEEYPTSLDMEAFYELPLSAIWLGASILSMMAAYRLKSRPSAATLKFALRVMWLVTLAPLLIAELLYFLFYSHLAERAASDFVLSIGVPAAIAAAWTIYMKSSATTKQSPGTESRD